MESPSALQENITPYISYDMFCTENETISKLPLDSKMQINIEAKNANYSESRTLFSVSTDGDSENVNNEEDFKQTWKLPSEPSQNVNEVLEKEVLIHSNTDEMLLKSSLNFTVKSEENSVSDLDSSTGVGKASSGYCTDTSEKEEIVTDESVTHKVTPPLCSNSSPPTSSSAASEVRPARSSANAKTRSTRTRAYSLRPRTKRRSKEVSDPQQDLLPFDMDKLLHCDYQPVTSEEIYLKKLIQQLDSTYTTAVVYITRLENMDPSLWRKYLSK